MDLRTLDSEVSARLLEQSLSEIHPALTRWLSREVLASNLHAHLAALVEHAGDLGRGRKQAAKHAVAGADAADYLPRLLRIPGDRWAVASPKFVADTLEFPYIVVWMRTFALDTPEVILATAAAADDAFAALKAERISLYQSGPPGADSPLRTTPRLSPYKRYLVAPSRQLVEAPPPPLADRLQVTPAEDLATFYDDYARMYDEFHADVPELRDHVRKETPADMQRFMEEGEMRLVWIDGRLAGVMAASPEVENGLRGWCMKERVLGREYRGAGFGPAALWAFIRSLPLEPDDMLWGTIVPENHASMRSALKLGRVDTGGYFWVDMMRGRG